MVAFADAAATSPTDGTGGAPTVTIARSVTTPLDGVGTFLFTKDAANRQGEGFSTDIALQPSDATKPFNLSFDYQITTGTYTGYQNPASFSDLTLWFYDVTNSVMYQLQGYQLDGAVSTTAQYSYQGSVQIPVGCLTGRLIWFLGNTGASAFTARFNNISFGRQPRVQGNITTPWTAWTPTGTWSTNTTYTGFWRRVGSNLEINVKVAVSGAPTSAALAINLPPGMTIDTAVLANGTGTEQILGTGFLFDSGGSNYPLESRYSTTTAVRVDFWDDAVAAVGFAGQVTQAAPITFGASDFLTFNATVPILGWGANGTLGQDADTRVVFAKYSMGTTYMMPTTFAAPFQYNTKIFDTHNGATYGAGVTFTYYVPVAGYYEVTAFESSSAAMAVAGNNDITRIILLANGTTFAGSDLWHSKVNSAGETIRREATGIVKHYFNAGDALVLTANSDGASYVNSVVPLNYCTIARISGPAQVQAPEVITARYSTNAGATITGNSVTIMDYEDQSYDDHGCVTTGASWKFTAPRAGKLRINAKATLVSNAGWGVGETAYLAVFKNGVEFGRGPFDSPVTATIVVNLSVEDEVNVVAGDYVPKQWRKHCSRHNFD
jgi:hypothetical protein